jgi:cytochrome bd-type quinol oxidase subunit 1
MVCLGSHFSGVWIVVANSWMQTPAGFRIVGEGMQARAQVADFWAMVFNPSMMDRLAHTIIAAWQAGAWLVVSVSAYYLLRKCHIDFAQRSFKVGISVAFVSALLQLVSGDSTVSVLGPQIANQLGWMTAEVGRQPWIVYGLLRTSEGLSKTVKADAVLGSLVLFTFIYVFLFALFIFLLNEKLQHGPELERPAHEGKVADALRDPQHFDQSRT